LELFSTKNTKTSQRAFNESNKIADILSGQEETKSVLKEEALLNEESQFEKMMSLANNKSARNKRAVKLERTKFYNENFPSLVEHFLFNVINEALLLDEEVKYINKEYMLNQVSAVSQHLVKQGSFDNVESATMKTVVESIQVHIDAMFEAKSDENSINAVRESYMNDIDSRVLYVAEVVKNKVAEAVRHEQTVASFLSESEEVNSKVNKDSLFKVIHIENVKNALKEENKNEVDEIVHERALAETLFDYTLLETINTLRIVKFDAEQLRNGMGRFFKEAKSSGKLQLGSLKVPKGTKEVSFEIFFEGNVVAFFMEDRNEVAPAVDISFSTKIEDIEGEIAKVTQEFKKVFRSTNLASKNPGVKFTFGYHDKPSTRVNL
jgi:hypothetical protein